MISAELNLQLASQAKSAGVSIDTVQKGSTSSTLPSWVTPKNVALGLVALGIGFAVLKKVFD